MSDNLARKTQKIFASGSGSQEIAAFGSMISGTPVYTDDPEVIQTEAYTKGWSAAVAYNTAPFMQEDNAVLYSLSYQIAYLLQKGFAEWDANTNYFTNGYCQYGGVPYVSLTDNNLGNNPSTDNGTNWQIKRFMEIATDDQAATGELENVAINPKQLQASVSNLQSQIDAITSASDVTDVVGTHAELEAYNTSGLSDKSIIKVLSDETQEGATTYYRWVISGSSGSWELIGQEGPYYTISQSDNTFVKKIDFATTTTAGIVTIGDGLTVSEDGVLKAAAVSGSGLEVGDIGLALNIDESKGLRRYLNGSIISINKNTQAFLNKLKSIQEQEPEKFVNEETWQAEATLNTDGLCDKFVIDEDAGTIRLPKYPKYILASSGNLTAPVIGNGYALGLNTNVGDQYWVQRAQGSPVYGTTYSSPTKGLAGQYISGSTISINTETYIGVSANPNNSGLIGDLSNSYTKLELQYFIQIATGAQEEVNITNQIELNNPFTLFETKYTENELYNLSWQKAGSLLTKAIYPSAYDALLIELNSEIEIGTTSSNGYTKRGLSVKNSTDSDITDYDFIVYQDNEEFKLPSKIKMMPLGETAPVIGNENAILYFYVGETVQNTNLIDAGRMQEELIDIKSSLVGNFESLDYLSIATNITVVAGNTQEFSLDSILPNDNKTYFCNIYTRCTPTKAGMQLAMAGAYHTQILTRGSVANVTHAISGWLAVDATRKIRISTAADTNWNNTSIYICSCIPIGNNILER